MLNNIKINKKAPEEVGLGEWRGKWNLLETDEDGWW